MPVDYQRAYSRMGQTLGQGLSGIGQSFSDVVQGGDVDVKRSREQDAYDLMMKKLENLDTAKKEASEWVAETMQGQPDKTIQRAKSYILGIEDKKELISKSLEYNQQLQDFEQNKGVYKTRPMFGIKAETYAKQNEMFKQKARQEELTGAVAATGRERFAPGQPEGQPQDVGGFTEQNIPTRERLPAAATQGQMAGAPEVQELAPTTQELGQVPQFATAPKQSDLDKQKVAEIKARREGKNDALGWANYALRKEGMEVTQLKPLEENVRKDETNAALQEFKRDLVDAEVKELEGTVKGLREQIENPTDPFADAEKIQIDLEKKTNELTKKRKEWAAEQQKLITAESKVDASNQALMDSLGKTGALSQYKRSLQRARTPAPAQPRERKPLGSYYQ